MSNLKSFNCLYSSIQSSIHSSEKIHTKLINSIKLYNVFKFKISNLNMFSNLLVRFLDDSFDTNFNSRHPQAYSIGSCP